MNDKFKNPYFWLGIFGIILSASGIDFETLTSWPLLLDALLSIVKNPVLIISTIVALLGVWSDNSSPGIDTMSVIFNNKK